MVPAQLPPGIHTLHVETEDGAVYLDKRFMASGRMTYANVIYRNGTLSLRVSDRPGA